MPIPAPRVPLLFRFVPFLLSLSVCLAMTAAFGVRLSINMSMRSVLARAVVALTGCVRWFAGCMRWFCWCSWMHCMWLVNRTDCRWSLSVGVWVADGVRVSVQVDQLRKQHPQFGSLAHASPTRLLNTRRAVHRRGPPTQNRRNRRFPPAQAKAAGAAAHVQRAAAPAAVAAHARRALLLRARRVRARVRGRAPRDLPPPRTVVPPAPSLARGPPRSPGSERARRSGRSSGQNRSNRCTQ
jgi:hypothetical protein